MSDQDNNLITAPGDVESYDADWLSAHRTTAEEQETARWSEGRTHDIATNRALRQALGYDYEGYRAQLETLSSGERLELVDKSPEEITAHLEERAASERAREKREEALEEERKEQTEANFRASETAELREVRKAMKTAFQEATSLDRRIAELQRLNDMRDDPSAKGWDDLPAERWRAAREGTQESLASEIGALIQEKQAKLQEAALHQNAYHEGARSIQAPQPAPSSNVPIGQIVGNDGRPVQLTRADIAQIVQLERDQQNYTQQAMETAKRYPDWKEAAQSAARAGVDVTAGQAQFIITLPNGPEVAYHLAKNHADARALARMNNHEATRELIRISHQLATRNASTAAPRQQTSAPKPPSPVSGSSRGDFDVNDESTSADTWFRKRNADLKRRGKSY